MTALLREARGPHDRLADDGFEVSYVPDGGAEHRVPLAQACAVPLEQGLPVRRFTSRKGQLLLLLGGDTTFVLARGGHALAIASPPGTKRASYRTSTSTVPDVSLKDSTDNPGSWWENWHDWIEKRAPASKPAPKALGSDAYPPLAAAVGDYVRRRLT